MSRSVLLGVMVFFGLWVLFPTIAFGAPIACTGVTTGNVGTCSTIVSCDGTVEEAASRMSNSGPVAICPTDWICCIPLASSDKPPKTIPPGGIPPILPDSCTSVDSGNTGTCRDACQGSEVAETSGGSCGSGGYCCVNYVTGGGANQGTACSISSSSGTQTGVCEFTDLCSGTKVASSTCTGGTECCLMGTSGGAPNQGAPCTVPSGGTGLCEFTSQCSPANSVSSPSCFGGTICCVTSGSGGPGATTCPATACSNTACVAPLANDNTKTSTTCPYCCVSGGVGPGTGSGACPTGYTKVSGVCFPGGTGLSDKSVLQILTTLISWLLAIFGLIALLGFIISGLQYLTSAGDEGQAETAKRNMQYAIIGVIVALSGWIVIQAVDRLLNANSLI